MSVWVLVPVKPLTRAKSRLATVLSAEQRTQLAEATLRHTLQVVMEVPQVTGVLVISRDGRVLSLAREMQAHTVQESGAPELNNALMRATQVLRSWRADAVLIIPADIPLINAEDLTHIIRMGQNAASVVITPDDKHDGTNALFVRPPGLFDYAYGENSFHHHQERAREADGTVYVYESERLCLDLDTPADLETYRRHAGAGAPGVQEIIDTLER